MTASDKSAAENYAALGLAIIPNFITVDEELELIAQIQRDNPTQKRKVVFRNTIRRYGSREPYFDNLVSATIPPHFLWLCDRLFQQQLVSALPDSVTVNEYYTGQTIAPHIDHVDAGPVVTILSLGAQATMLFSRGQERLSVELPPRSITQMRDQIRYGWQHEIAPVPALRYSLVFRDSISCRRKI